MPWLQGLRPGNRKLPLVPGGEASREAVVALYLACGFPAPKVLVAGNQDEFDALRAKVSATAPLPVMVVEMVLGSFAAVLICFFMGAVAEVETEVHAALASTNGAYGPSRSMHVISTAVSVLTFFGWVALLAVPLLRRVLDPTCRSAVPMPGLVDAIVSAGCLAPPPRGNDPSRALADLDFVSWGSGDGSVLPDLPSEVGNLAVAARRTVDAAFLAGGTALVLPAGLGGNPATHPMPDRRSASWGKLRRQARQIRSLDPAEAQDAAASIGVGRVVRVLDLRPISTDASGSLWQLEVSRGRLRWLQSTDPATGNDVWIPVPGHVTSAREAAAWSFGVSAADYAPTLEG